MRDLNKLDGLQNWDEGEDTNIPSITEFLDVAGFKLLSLLLFSMQSITTGAKMKPVKMKDL